MDRGGGEGGGDRFIMEESTPAGHGSMDFFSP